MAQNPKNNSRASELGDVLTDGATGFVVRKRSGIGLFFHLFLLACMILFGSAMLVYYRSPVGCLLAVSIGLSFGLIAQNLERYKKMKESLEFMNALFSSAVGKGYTCCFIVKSSGEIVFYNRPFQTVFPAYTTQNTRTLGTLLELYNVPQVDRDKLNGLMSSATAGSVTTTLHSADATDAQKITFEIESIERPTGFFLVRGK